SAGSEDCVRIRGAAGAEPGAASGVLRPHWHGMGAMGAIHKNASVAAQPRRRADLVSGSTAAHPRNGALRHTSLGRITMKPRVRIAGSRVAHQRIMWLRATR